MAASYITARHGKQRGAWEVSAGENGHSYKAVALTNDITWTEAERLARIEGGYLATVTSSAENEFVFSLVNAPEFFSANYGVGPALGGFQPDGYPTPASGEPWSYQNWQLRIPSCSVTSSLRVAASAASPQTGELFRVRLL